MCSRLLNHLALAMSVLLNPYDRASFHASPSLSLFPNLLARHGSFASLCCGCSPLVLLISSSAHYLIGPYMLSLISHDRACFPFPLTLFWRNGDRWQFLFIF